MNYLIVCLGGKVVLFSLLFFASFRCRNGIKLEYSVECKRDMTCHLISFVTKSPKLLLSLSSKSKTLLVELGIHNMNNKFVTAIQQTQMKCSNILYIRILNCSMFHQQRLGNTGPGATARFHRGSGRGHSLDV